MLHRALSLAWLLTLTSFLAPTLLRATSVVAPAFTELVSEAQLIARVEVTAVRPAWVQSPQGRVIKTFVTFSAKKILKGTTAAEFTLSFLGGEIDDQGMRINGMPRFAVGQTAIVFVSDQTGASFCPLVGLMHGRYHVRTDEVSGRAYVARNDGTPLESETDVQLPQSENPAARSLRSISRALSPEAFEAKITAEASRPAAQP